MASAIYGMSIMIGPTLGPTLGGYLTDHFGFITDYLAEAFHYQFKHVNRYEEVSKRIRLGKAIEGRDERHLAAEQRG